MKQLTQWIAALFTVASAGLAMGCGCSSDSVRLEPVREQIIQRNVCTVQQPVIISSNTCLADRPSGFWTSPSSSNTAFVVGNVLSSRVAYVGSYDSLEPVGERITTVTKTSHFKCGTKHHMLKKVTYLNEPMLMPVGERLTTVKVIRTQPLLMPVGERFTTVRVIHRPLLQPVGERITTIRHIQMQPVLEPIGERTIIRTTRSYVNPWNSCDF